MAAPLGLTLKSAAIAPTSAPGVVGSTIGVLVEIMEFITGVGPLPGAGLLLGDDELAIGTMMIISPTIIGAKSAQLLEVSTDDKVRHRSRYFIALVIEEVFIE